MEWALARTKAALRRHDIAAALLVDPVNIRYATGTAIMPVWTLHSIDRYLLVPAEGEPVLWERGIYDGRIGVDRLDAYGFLALQEADLHLVPPQLAIEQARERSVGPLRRLRFGGRW